MVEEAKAVQVELLPLCPFLGLKQPYLALLTCGVSEGFLGGFCVCQDGACLKSTLLSYSSFSDPFFLHACSVSFRSPIRRNAKLPTTTFDPHTRSSGPFYGHESYTILRAWCPLRPGYKQAAANVSYLSNTRWLCFPAAI